MAAFTRRKIIWLLVLPLMIAAVLSLTTIIPVGDALAQERVKRRSVIEMLFGPRRARPEKTNRQPTREIRRSKKQRSNSRSVSRIRTRKAKTRAAQRAPEIIEKIDNARKVLVIGDFMAKSLAQGLDTAFAQSPGVAIMHESNGSSGAGAR